MLKGGPVAKYLLPVLLIAMIFSYQNCGQQFDVSQYQQASQSNGSNGGGNDDGNVDVVNPPEDPGFDYSSLRLEMNNTSQTQFSEFEARVITDEPNLLISMSYKCPDQLENFAAASSCQNHIGYCVRFSCDRAGSGAYVRASALASNGDQVLIDEESLSVLAIDKQTLEGAIQLNMPATASKNQNFVVAAEVNSSLSGDSDYSLNWSVSPSNICTVVSSNTSSATIRCSQEGIHTVSASASSLRYQSSANYQVQVGDPELDLSIKLYANSSSEISVGHEYVLDVEGQDGAIVSGYKWSLDSGDCSITSATTTGVRNTIVCSKVPNGSDIEVGVAVTGDNYYTGSATKTLDVGKGAYSVSVSGAAQKQEGEKQSLTANVNKYHMKLSSTDSIPVTNFSGLTFKWTLCIDSSKGEAGTVVNVSNSNTISTDATACNSPGTKSFKVEVSSTDYSGAGAANATITEKPDEYYWDSQFLFGAGANSVTKMCSSYSQSTCNAANLGKVETCCYAKSAGGGGELKKLGEQSLSLRVCIDAVKYTCKVR